MRYEVTLERIVTQTVKKQIIASSEDEAWNIGERMLGVVDFNTGQTESIEQVADIDEVK